MTTGHLLVTQQIKFERLAIFQQEVDLAVVLEVPLTILEMLGSWIQLMRLLRT